MKNPLRLGRAAVALAGLVLGLSGAVAISSAANASALSNGGDVSSSGHCVTPSTSSYDSTLTISADGKTATAVVSAKSSRLCDQAVTLVSYIAPAPTFAVPQYIFDQGTKTIGSDNQTVTWSVAVPTCNTQVDLFLGSTVINPLTTTSDRYGDKKLQWKNFGASNCVQPAVQAIPNCDGSIDLQLSNSGLLATDDGYDVDFTISYGKTSQKVTVGAKKTQDVLVPAGSGAVIVVADTLNKSFSWQRPDTCVPATTGKNDCKTVTITVTNPEANVAVTADVTYNGTTKTVSVPAGQSTDVTFDSATDVDTATVTFTSPADLPVQTVTIVRGDCATTPPSTPPTSASASPSDSVSPSASTSTGVTSPSAAVSTSPAASSLPLTGSAASTVAGGAVLLLIIGGVVFFLARRRKVNFTA